MSLPPAPFKTPLGLDELRHRTRGLGQRHRTVLLLVDGQRTLGDVLGMAHRAGASTSHFEELVRLGLVEMPIETTPPDALETAPGALDLLKLTTVEVDVPAGPAAEPDTLDLPVLLHEPAPVFVAVAPVHDDGPDTVGNPDVPPLDVPLLDVPLGEPPLPDARERPVRLDEEVQAPPVRQPAAAALPATRPAAPPPTLPRRADAPPPAAPPATPHVVADHARPRAPTSDAVLRQQVRSLLLGSMGGEAALFSPLTLTRIRVAQTTRDLIALVWEIERQRNHVRRSRAQLWSLEKARELLGMGNTLVAGDSQPGGTWPDTGA